MSRVSEIRMTRLKTMLRPDGEKSNTKKTAALALATMFNSLLSLLMSMALARVLTKSDLAAYSQVNMVLTTVFPFLQLGIPSGIYYILSRNKGRERAVINEAMLCVTLGTALFAAFLIFGGNRLLAERFGNEEIRIYLLYIIPTCLFQLLSSVAGTIMVYEDRVSFSAKYNVVVNLLRMTITIAAILILRSVLRTVQVNAGMQVLTGLASVYLIYAFMVPRDDGKMRLFSIKQLLKVSIPLGVAAMVVTLNSFLDKWIISLMCTPEEYAVFVSGAHEVPFITAITNSVMTVIIVPLTEAYRDGDYAKALDLVRNAARSTSMLLMPIMLMCFALAGPIICFIFTERYAGAISIFIVYLLYMPYWTIYYGPIMTAMGKPNAVLYCAFAGLLCNAAISVACVRLLGPIGASIATIATVYAVNLPLNLRVICKEMNVKWTQLLPLKHYGICILLSVPGAVLCWLAAHLLSDLAYFWQLAAGGCVFLAVTVPIFVWHFKLPWKDALQSVRKKFSEKRSDV